MKVRNVTPKPRARRSYSSPLREKQAAGTRTLIIDGLLEQLARDGIRELSIPHVAKRAGVTPRTVYRYFPTREALLHAVDVEMEARIGSLFDVQSTAEIVESVRPQFATFAENATLVQALLQAGVGGEIRERGRQRRTERLRAALSKQFPQLSAGEVHRTGALIHYLFSAGSWETLQRVWGLSSDEAADTVEWGVRTLIDALQRRANAAGRMPTRSKTVR